MQGAISSLKGIRDWFYNQQAPFWTLSYYSSASPTGMGHVISRNTRFGDMEQSWEMLQQSIEAQTGSGRAQLNLIIYEKSAGANTPSGRTNIDIISSQVPGMPQVAGIGNLPALGYVDEARVNAIISEKEVLWELRRENEDLKAALDNPNGFADKAMAFIERIGETPLGMAIASKLLGGQMPPMIPPSPVNGTPAPPSNGEDEDVEPVLDTLEIIAQKHGMTLKQFLEKTVTLANQQPGVVQMLSQQ